LIVLHVYGELAEQDRPGFEQHLRDCASCAVALAAERKLQGLMGQRATREPSADFLARCRMGLEESLDFDGHISLWQRLRQGFQWVNPLAVHPALSAALLVLFGVLLGWQVQSKLGGRPRAFPAPAMQQAAMTPDDFQIAGINSIATDADTGQVVVSYDAARRVTLRGTPQDPAIQRVLLLGVRSYDNSGLRLESVDALRREADQAQVRRALIAAMLRDKNPGVRLRALDGLKKYSEEPEVRHALLQALEKDLNPGVRVECINALTEVPDPEVIRVLRALAGKDKNNYVRMKSAAAVQQASIADQR
jgi:hypothetical protein